MKVEKNMSVEDVLEALKTLELLGTLSDKAEAGEVTLATEPESRAVDQDELVRRLEEGVKLKQLHRVRKPARKRKSWQAKRKTKKLRKQRQYQNRSARRNAEWAEMLGKGDAESWYKWFSRVSNTSWATKKGWEISKEDYSEFIHPALRGRVPTVQRYDTKKPWSMKNTLWVDTETRAVLFDGAQYYLEKMGYCVPSRPSTEGQVFDGAEHFLLTQGYLRNPEDTLPQGEHVPTVDMVHILG